MLSTLRVRDLVLIDELDLELHRGFNVLTGETGAGKSILVGAIGLALGARASAELVRSGARHAEVEALFDIGDEPAARLRIAEAGWGAADELLVRRSISAEGRSRCWVNGHPVPLSMLAELARGLAELSSQHEHHALADPSTHVYSLDAFARLDPRRAEVAAAHRAVLEATAELERVRRLGVEQDLRLALIAHQLASLEGLAPAHGEETALTAELDVLRASNRLLEVAHSGESDLYSADRSASEIVASVASRIRDVAGVDPSLRPFEAELDEARALLEDVADGLRRYADRLEADPGRLAFVEERLDAFHRVRRALGERTSDLADRLEALRRESEEHESREQLELEAQRRLGAQLGRAGELALGLSSKRKVAARKLGRAVVAELADLGMGEARVAVRVEPAEGGEPAVGGARLGETGIDRVEILIAPNAGEPARPLARIASGGELSRAALALKRSMAGVGPIGTSVFDEVDAGIGGAVADMVGRKLREVSTRHQVLCVTHLPQVAALADTHFHVSKARRGGRTVTRVALLDPAGRVEEVARMISGSRVTARSRAAAEELIRAR